MKIDGDNVFNEFTVFEMNLDKDSNYISLEYYDNDDINNPLHVVIQDLTGTCISHHFGNCIKRRCII